MVNIGREKTAKEGPGVKSNSQVWKFLNEEIFVKVNQ